MNENLEEFEVFHEWILCFDVIVRNIERMRGMSYNNNTALMSNNSHISPLPSLMTTTLQLSFLPVSKQITLVRFNELVFITGHSMNAQPKMTLKCVSSGKATIWWVVVVWPNISGHCPILPYANDEPCMQHQKSELTWQCHHNHSGQVQHHEEWIHVSWQNFKTCIHVGIQSSIAYACLWWV